MEQLGLLNAVAVQHLHFRIFDHFMGKKMAKILESNFDAFMENFKTESCECRLNELKELGVTFAQVEDEINYEERLKHEIAK